MSKSPAFQFYPSDWLSSSKVNLMTPAEEGAYIRLLAYEWQEDDCGLPDDDKALSQLSRLGEEWFNGGSRVLRACFKAKGNRLYNERLLAEREKQSAWREKSRLGGIHSAESRKNKGIEGKGEGKGGSQMVGDCLQPNRDAMRAAKIIFRSIAINV